MIVSPGAKSGKSVSMVASTGAPAGTIIMIARGGAMAATSASTLSCFASRGPKSPARAKSASTVAPSRL